MPFCEAVLSALCSITDVVLTLINKVHCFGMVSSNYGSLIAALIAAMILFVIRESINKADNYSGTFYIKKTVEETAYNPYRGMDHFYTLIIYSDGHVISGTSEKTGEISAAGAKEYIGSDRTRGVINGVVERNYIRSSVMNIHITEQGSREYTTYMSIKVARYRLTQRPLIGRFYSTAGNVKGVVLCGREEFNEHPTR